MMQTDAQVSFLGIGAPRSGTTWFVKCLSEHPQIFIPTVKETLFFTRYLNKGIDWYKNHFSEALPGQILGEFSTEYLYDSNVASLALSLNPDMKFIVILRNPVDRTFSHYLYYKYSNFTRSNLDLALKQHPELMDYSLYHKHLKIFIEKCPNSPLLVLMYEDIITKPKNVLKQTFSFLGVDENFVPKIYEKKINSTKDMSFYFPALNRWYTSTTMFRTHYIKSPTFANYIMYILKKFIVSSLIKNTKVSQREVEDIDPIMKKKLEHIFAEDVLRLEHLLQRNLSMWITDKK